MTRTKRIFISDIHMGTAESIQGDAPYGWLLKDRAELLTDFLNQLIADQSLAELVIVGDLFDEWVVPYGVSPTPEERTRYANQFEKIANAEQNAPIIAALSKLANNPEVSVSYVPGNHDMLMECGIIQKIISDKIKPHIDGPGQGSYSQHSVAAEHGSLYCLFNGPDSYSNPGHSIPLGFFVARSQAEGVTTGHPVTKKQYIEVVLNAIWKMIHGEPMAESIFDAIVKEVQAPTNDIEMNGLDDYAGDISTGKAGDIFKDIFQQWDHEMPDNVPATIAALGETGNLFPAVLLKYALSHQSDEKVVVFGHTHQWDIRGLDFSITTIKEIAECIPRVTDALKENDTKKALSILDGIGDPGPNKSSDFIYANSGTWIDGDSGSAEKEMPPATYVEIETTTDRTNVRVMAYNGGALEKSTLLDERFLT